MSVGERIVAFAREAKRRRVYTSAIAYIVVAVTVIELSGAIYEALDLPDWSGRLTTILLMLGFPVVVVMAWVFDITASGVRRTETEPRRPAGPAPAVRRVGLGDAPAVDVDDTLSAAEDEEEEVPAPAPVDPERLKRAAIGHVRHELKTPINGILGYSEMLLEDLEEGDSDGMEADLHRIRAAGQELLRLIDRTLDPDEIERAEEIDLEAYGAQIRADLRNPINAVIGYAEMLIEDAEESGRGQVVADLGRIRDSAQRLLELSTDVVEVATAHTDVQGAEGRLQAANTLTESVLARAHLRKAADEDALGRLLVVDDNPTNRDLLARQLARAGFEVETAEGGGDALDLLADRPFDLVLLDVIMPDVDGLEVLRRVKTDRGLKDTPVIMLSSLDDVESALRCIELGAEDFLHKPFHPTLLRARIGASLEVRRMRDRLRGSGGGVDPRVAPLVRASAPEAIAQRVRDGDDRILEAYEAATVAWCDLDGSARTKARDPGVVARRLGTLLDAVEAAADEAGIDTVLPAGGGVALVSGVPEPDGDHAGVAARAALRIAEALGGSGFDAPVRLGLDTGALTGGVFGERRKAYRLWGDPFELAQRLGNVAEAGSILVSPAAHRALGGGFVFESLGVRDLPGRGQMKTYRLTGPA